MPGMDGTGPLGMGPMTGRGLGWCARPAGYGLRGFFGRGRRFRRYAGWSRPVPYYGGYFPESEKEFLASERAALEEELRAVTERLKELGEDE